ncbi:Nif3-like dinuclear metal center hexameric protein [Brachybacterium sp. Z12]|uniref:Nif3-like dinuclear metal center hexameric protein n=1 Tax=Brachybacterium sp. Z12 TaxID=2759167 RepID=UPI00223B8E80|nr:Nif3-like dinuclear metal center hexameric protein [Brachybacterium sp. Z12]
MSTVSSTRTVDAVIGALEEAYPLSWAESWDRVGLVLGERGAEVRRVLLAVDPTVCVAREAVERDAQLLVTHHPLLLRGASFLPADEGKGAVVTTLLRHGTALWCGHTNVDRSTRGTVGAWISALDLQDAAPLVPGSRRLRRRTIPIASDWARWARSPWPPPSVGWPPRSRIWSRPPPGDPAHRSR